MELYEVIEKRRTIRDFSDKEVSTETLKRILEAGMKAPSNDHLRNIEFVVIKGRDTIAGVIKNIAENTKNIQMKWLDASKDTLDPSERDMFYDALPKQQKMLIESGCLVIPFFKQSECELLQPEDQSSLNYFASTWLAIENILLAATAEGLACAIRIPIGDEAEHVRNQVNAPGGWVMACFLAIGYAAENAVLPKQKPFNPEDKIHINVWK
jgi:Nitroreductase